MSSSQFPNSNHRITTAALAVSNLEQQQFYNHNVIREDAQGYVIYHPASSTSATLQHINNSISAKKRRRGIDRKAICEHNKRRTQCIQCYDNGTGGGSVCQHRKRKDGCSICKLSKKQRSVSSSSTTIIRKASDPNSKSILLSTERSPSSSSSHHSYPTPALDNNNANNHVTTMIGTQHHPATLSSILSVTQTSPQPAHHSKHHQQHQQDDLLRSPPHIMISTHLMQSDNGDDPSSIVMSPHPHAHLDALSVVASMAASMSRLSSSLTQEVEKNGHTQEDKHLDTATRAHSNALANEPASPPSGGFAKTSLPPLSSVIPGASESLSHHQLTPSISKSSSTTPHNISAANSPLPAQHPQLAYSPQVIHFVPSSPFQVQHQYAVATHHLPVGTASAPTNTTQYLGPLSPPAPPRPSGPVYYYYQPAQQQPHYQQQLHLPPPSTYSPASSRPVSPAPPTPHLQPSASSYSPLPVPHHTSSASSMQQLQQQQQQQFHAAASTTAAHPVHVIPATQGVVPTVMTAAAATVASAAHSAQASPMMPSAAVHYSLAPIVFVQAPVAASAHAVQVSQMYPTPERKG